MSNSIHELLSRMNASQPISQGLAKGAMLELFEVESDVQCSALLGAMLSVPHAILTEEVVAGYIDAISEAEGRNIMTDKKQLTVPEGKLIVGLAGSGKKGVKTVNVTTPSMIIATAMGTYCAKAGSRSTSSLMGSVDLLEGLGIKVLTEFAKQQELFNKTGFGFFPIEDTIIKFDKHYGNRFISPHALSLALPAAVLPVKVDTIMYGYAAPDIYLCARVLQYLGYNNAFIVNNTKDLVYYVDEMLATGMTNVVGVVNGTIGRTRSFNAGEFVGATNTHKEGAVLQRISKKEQVNVIIETLKGNLADSEIENALCITAGTIAYIAHDVKSPQEGFDRAKEIVRSGEAYTHLQKIIEISNNV